MRASILLLLVLASACSGSGETAARAADALDCQWVRDTTNCWRAMTAAVDGCLSADASQKGVLSDDRLSCTYEAGRTVTSSVKLGSTDASLSPTRSFEVKTAAGLSCVRVDEASDVLTITYAGGVVKLSTVGSRVELTCPDGATFKGSDADLGGCLSPANAVPGYSWSTDATTTTDANRVSFSLIGMTGPLYACVRPSSASGG